MKIFHGSEVSFWVRVGKFLQYGFLCGARVSPIASIAKEEIVGSLNVACGGRGHKGRDLGSVISAIRRSTSSAA